jgi:hypothetical protein
MHMRWPLVTAMLFGCGHHSGKVDAGEADAFEFKDACTELSCFQFDCASKGLPSTTISGTVYAPNGTLKLYGVDVYVPRSDPGPLIDGVRCETCSAGLQGGSFAQTRTDEDGHFVLENVPATANVPLVIQIGKWRRQLTVPNVAACQDLALSVADTRLPKDSSEGELPRIAISTGAADAIECLVYRLGIAPTEFTAPAGTGRVHMFSNQGIGVPTNQPPSSGRGTDRFNATWPGGANALFGSSQALWADAPSLSTYDIVMLSCEGSQFPATKPQTALDALRSYADAGGRVFMSHWHNIWIGGNRNDLTHGVPEWQSVATWNFSASQSEVTQLDIVDETVPKGMSFATWLLNNNVPPPRGQLIISEPRYTCADRDATKAERWVYVDPALSTPLGRTSIQDLLFTTPQSKPPEERCGKVVFSDMHVSSGSVSGAGASGTTYAYPFPDGCSTGDLTPQEKALAFIFFDISSCVGTLF